MKLHAGATDVQIVVATAKALLIGLFPAVASCACLHLLEALAGFAGRSSHAVRVMFDRLARSACSYSTCNWKCTVMTTEVYYFQFSYLHSVQHAALVITQFKSQPDP